MRTSERCYAYHTSNTQAGLEARNTGVNGKSEAVESGNVLRAVGEEFGSLVHTLSMWCRSG